MRLEWLEDLVAVLEAGSLNEAAGKRFLSQPAFSRRIRAIEAHLGVDLLDRSRKPVRPAPALLGRQEELRRVAGDLGALIRTLRQAEEDAGSRVVIASQHAIATSVLPELIAGPLSPLDLKIRLRSANRSDCAAMLINKEADLTVTYRSRAEVAAGPEAYLEECVLGTEALLPVAAPNFAGELSGETLPLIAYPPDVFLGKWMAEEILPAIAEFSRPDIRVETALTLAALRLAETGVGVAWLPGSMAADAIDAGRLANLSGRLPAGEVAVVATRLIGARSALEQRIWSVLADAAKA
ncbi:LysR family transcriptional regulator [Rhodobium gokarnense]|uniref:DNA-binding transcriptional LysR family regulator n=1 Tax=Rhodobium gokarnense TaxID=364296 RepID=A0ABT3HDL9_9HYPH|nr:LysR family transcriptional regulator [Rhodobium gokarnense]MCW2308485.1 DNA-binding transcriptional LysR family regulator [Rhodobium gokarnense]